MVPSRWGQHRSIRCGSQASCSLAAPGWQWASTDAVAHAQVRTRIRPRAAPRCACCALPHPPPCRRPLAGGGRGGSVVRCPRPSAGADSVQWCPWQLWQQRLRRACCQCQSAGVGHDAPVAGAVAGTAPKCRCRCPRERCAPPTPHPSHRVRAPSSSSNLHVGHRSPCLCSCVQEGWMAHGLQTTVTLCRGHPIPSTHSTARGAVAVPVHHD